MKIKKDIQNSLREFIGLDGIIDGTKLQENWFPTKQKFDVFLSHSHNDEKLAICLAGFLKEKLDLDTFIDSCLWRYSNDLLKELDKNTASIVMVCLMTMIKGTILQVMFI